MWSYGEYIELDQDDEDKIKKLLMYRKVVKITGGFITLDNGVELLVRGNEGCLGCGSGSYSIMELNKVDNAITNVEFVCDSDVEDNEYDDTSYKIFVFCEDKRIKLLQADGSDGNGYYGTGYYIKVNKAKLPEEVLKELLGN